MKSAHFATEAVFFTSFSSKRWGNCPVMYDYTSVVSWRGCVFTRSSITTFTRWQSPNYYMSSNLAGFIMSTCKGGPFKCIINALILMSDFPGLPMTFCHLIDCNFIIKDLAGNCPMCNDCLLNWAHTHSSTRGLRTCIVCNWTGFNLFNLQWRE